MVEFALLDLDSNGTEIAYQVREPVLYGLESEVLGVSLGARDKLGRVDDVDARPGKAQGVQWKAGMFVPFSACMSANPFLESSKQRSPRQPNAQVTLHVFAGGVYPMKLSLLTSCSAARARSLAP